jgi:hypothetical protein
VDVVRAAPPVPDWEPSAPPSIHLLLDVTSSMRAASTGGVTHLQAARRVAERFLYSLSPDADVEMHLLGTAIGSACTRAVPVEPSPGTSPGDGLVPVARALPSRSEGSLAGALEAIARQIRSEAREGAGVRFVVISDLDDSCAEGDLCEAAAAVASAGADLDLVVIGAAAVPACLDEVGSDLEPPLLAAAPAAPLRATFRVIGEEQGEEVSLSAAGMVGGDAVTVAPGRIRIGVDLDPPVEVGPLDLPPNGLLQIRILGLPRGQSRAWQVFVEMAKVRGAEGSIP